MEKKKSSTLLNTVVLVVLAIVNQITLEPIAQADVNQKAEIYKVVYPGCDSFTEFDNAEEMISNSASLLEGKGLGNCKINDVLGAEDASGNIEGYIVAATSSAGYGGDVEIAIGIKDGKITGFSSIKNSETAGLGAKCSEPEFTGQFAGKAASMLTYTKTGASSDTEIDAISGATITTNAVTQAVNAAIIFYQENFAGGAQDVAKPDLTEYYQKAYPGANTFDDIENSDKLLESNGLSDCTIEEVKSVNGGEGYVISATGTGFAKTSPFQIAIGIKDNKITGFAVVSSTESEGYGAKMNDDSFTSQFAGKSVGIMTAKAGGTADNEIDAISGATITTNGVTKAVNAIVVFYQTNFGDASSIDTSSLQQNASADATAGATK